MDEFQKLDSRVQKWVYKQGWPDLREIQKKAISAIMSGDQDVLISASTAAGKTEAFFLPACSMIADKNDGFGILYISPLKALINDQTRRLEGLCEMLDMNVTPWHGDSLRSKKNKAKKDPSGIILITPESLESLMIREPGWLRDSFQSLKYIVIDEFHAFIGSERGLHLLSLLNRLEHLVDRYEQPIPRVALSATLGELDKVPLSLRPNSSLPCQTVTDSSSQSTVRVKILGYQDPLNMDSDGTLQPAEYQICRELYKICRGDSHLIFANSRQRTENIAAQLSDFCEQDVVPNEFFPHHGSLAKELREDLETRLQKETLPTTAICTMTLELGIDIGKVNSVAQVTAPHSVSSLRQRMGRSGRRGTPAILRMFISENELKADSNLIDKLRMELVQSIAMIRLLISSKWFEPADTKQMHLSTLLHQVLAVTAQWGGVRADQLYTLLCQTGPFQKITIQHFRKLLTHMGEIRMLTQLSSGELILGLEGERVVNHYTFYAVFKTPEEYRVVVGNNTLGTIPIDSLIIPNQHIVFGGRRWKALEIDAEKKVIYVEASKGGKPPRFGGAGMSIHDVVRQEMYKIYSDGDYRITAGNTKVDFIDSSAKILFDEGVSSFRENNLQSQSIIQQGKNVCIHTWMGDKIVNTLSTILIQKGFEASPFAGVVEIENTTVTNVKEYLKSLCEKGFPSNTSLAELVPEKNIEKYDALLPLELLNEDYGRKMFDIIGTQRWVLGLQ